MVDNTKIRILEHSRKSMRFHNLWPATDILSPEQRKSFYLKLFFTYMFCFPAWTLLVFHLWHVQTAHLDVDISEDLAVLSSVTGIHYVNILVISKQKEIALLMQKLSNFKEFGKPPTFDKTNKFLNLISKIYFYYCTNGAAMYFGLRIYEYPKCTKNKNDKGFYEICGLVYPGWLPVNVDGFPWQQLISLYTFAAVIIVMRGGVTISFTVYEIARHVTVRIEHLCELLTKCFDDDDPVQKQNKLEQCLRYYHHVIQLHEDFDFCYGGAMGVNIFMAAAILGSLSNQLVNEKSIAPLIHLWGWIMALFVVCAAGQVLIDKSLEIAEAAYDSKWYNATVNQQKDLKLLIMRAQKPFYLHARPLGILSYELFGTIVKTSYSYLTLLNNQEE